MIRSTTQPNRLSITFRKWFSKNRLSVTSMILIVGLISFEMFNYSTTDYALRDLLGDLKFFGIFWSTILAIAFCGIDFAGIIRLFMPDDQLDQKENWFLFGAWFLAATMNAVLTWWGVAMSLTTHPIHSTAIMDPTMISQGVPIFVAIMVWLTRILLIGSFSLKNNHRIAANSSTKTNSRAQESYSRPHAAPTVQPVRMNSSTTTVNRGSNRIINRPEPEYISDGNSISPQPTYSAPTPTQQNSRRF